MNFALAWNGLGNGSMAGYCRRDYEISDCVQKGVLAIQGRPAAWAHTGSDNSPVPQDDGISETANCLCLSTINIKNMWTKKKQCRLHKCCQTKDIR